MEKKREDIYLQRIKWALRYLYEDNRCSYRGGSQAWSKRRYKIFLHAQGSGPCPELSGLKGFVGSNPTPRKNCLS